MADYFPFIGPHGINARELPWQLFVVIGLAIVISTTIHEWGHAYMADRLGDGEPRRLGRLSLSPFRHFDLLGGLVTVATTLLGFPVGWGKAVRTDPDTYTVGRRRGIALVASAGPLANLLLAVALAPVARGFISGGIGSEAALYVFLLTALIILVCLSMFFCNFLPVYPLDGAHLLASALPPDLGDVYASFMARYGSYIFVGLMLSEIPGRVVGPLIIAAFRFLVGI